MRRRSGWRRPTCGALGQPGARDDVGLLEQLEHARQGSPRRGRSRRRSGGAARRRWRACRGAPRALAHVLLVAEQPHALVVEQRREALDGGVGARVVHHDDLPVAAALLEPRLKRRDGAGHGDLFVEGGHDNRYPRLAHVFECRARRLGRAPTQGQAAQQQREAEREQAGQAQAGVRQLLLAGGGGGAEPSASACTAAAVGSAAGGAWPVSEAFWAELPSPPPWPGGFEPANGSLYWLSPAFCEQCATGGALAAAALPATTGSAGGAGAGAGGRRRKAARRARPAPRRRRPRPRPAGWGRVRPQPAGGRNGGRLGGLRHGCARQEDRTACRNQSGNGDPPGVTLGGL